MQLKKFIIITTDFIGWHYWAGAHGQFDYLSKKHRHKFVVKAYKEITHNNREIEFINFKQRVTEYLRHKYEYQEFPSSCEDIAEDVLKFFGCYSVEVLEDGENGALIMSEKNGNA